MVQIPTVADVELERLAAGRMAKVPNSFAVDVRPTLLTAYESTTLHTSQRYIFQRFQNRLCFLHPANGSIASTT